MADVTQSIDVRIKTAIDSANAETSLRSLRGALKDLQSLAEEAADSNTGAFEQLEAAINSVEGRIGDASDRLRVMAGEPLERVRNGFSLIGEGIKNLDFTKATIGIDGLASGIKNMNVGDFKKGIESVTGSFINLGKALLGNPIFLLATIIITLINNFDKLANAGGIVGKVFSAIGTIIENITNFIKDLSDAIGLTGLQVEATFDRLKAGREGLNDMIETLSDLRDSADLSTVIEKSGILRNIWIDSADELEKLANQYTLTEAQLDGLTSKFKELRDAQMNQISGADEDMAAYRKSVEQTYGKDHAEKMLTALKDEYEKYYKWQVYANIEYNKQILDAEKSANEARKVQIETIRNQRQKEVASENEDYIESTATKNRELRKQVDNLIESTNLSLKSTVTSAEDKKKIIQQAEDKLGTILVKRSEENRTKSLFFNQLIVSDEEKKFKEIESRTTLHNQRIRDINLKYQLENIKNQQENAKDNFDYQSKLLDLYNSKAYFTTEEYELMKQTMLKEFNKEEEQRIIKNYDTQIKLAAGNADKIKFLQDQKTLALKNLKLDEEIFIKASNERILKNEEDVAKERERFAKERYEINKQIKDSEIQTTQSHIDNLNIELGLLDTQSNKYKNVYSEKRDLIMEQFATEGMLLQQKMDAELLANETNTINKEQRDLEIKAHYAELEKELAKNTSEELINIKNNELDRKGNLAKNYVDLVVNLDSFVRDIQRIGLSETKKEEEKSARQRFVIQKIAGALSVGIDTAIGITKAMALNPLTGGMPQTAFIAAAGAANIAAILAKQFTYGGGGSAAGSSGISATAPNVGTPPTLNTSSMYNPSAFYGIGTQRTNESTFGQYAQRVYVVESDITGTQKKVQVQADRATLQGR